MAALPALLTLLAGASGIACSQAERPGRVLIIGIDGATMRVIEPMIAAGRLPNLEAIARTGASGRLHSLLPLLSPRIWTSVATGKPPDEHGILGWVLPRKTGEATRLYDSHDRRVHALWNIFSHHGRSVATVNWLMSYPPEPVNGVMISDYAYPEEVRARMTLAAPSRVPRVAHCPSRENSARPLPGLRSGPSAPRPSVTGNR
jgi:hypothetical protein